MGDWYYSLKNDKEQFGINISDKEIKKNVKNKFKILVKSKMEEVAKRYLLKLKNKHSKMKNIAFNKIKMSKLFDRF